MLPNRHLPALAASFTLLLTVACGGRNERRDARTPGASPQGAAGVVDPCDLVTRQDAERVLGVAFQPGELTKQAAVGQSQCIYHSTGKAGARAMLQVTVSQQAAMPQRGGLTPEALYRSIKSQGFPDAPRLEGAGEESFLAPPGVHILHQGYYLTVSVGLVKRDREALLKETAAIALGNLDRLSAR